MKKLFLAIAIIGMTGSAFAQQQQSTSSSSSKDAKCSKACMKSCGKSCKKGSCTNISKSTSISATSTSAPSNTTK